MNVKILIAIIWLVAPSAQAWDYSFPNKPYPDDSDTNAAPIALYGNKNLVLSGYKCNEVKNEIEQLSKWSSTFKKKACAVPETHPLRSGGCWSEITDCVPKWLFDDYKHGDGVKQPGANCYNFALVLKHILPTFRFVDAEEVSFFMTSPLCRELKPGEQKELYDFGLIKDQTGTPWHEFVYVSDGLVLERANMTYPITLTPITEEPLLSFNDSKFSNTYFRCQSMQEYLDAHPGNGDLLKAVKDLDQLECNFTKNMLTTEGPSISSTAVVNLTDSFKALTAYLKSMEGVSPQTEQRKFLLGDLKVRLDSIGAQMNFLINGLNDIVPKPPPSHWRTPEENVHMYELLRAIQDAANTVK